MADLIFRLAAEADLRTVVALLADDQLGHARESLGDTLDPAYHVAFESIQSSPDNELVVAEQDGRVVGCLQITYIPGLSMRGGRRGLIEAVRVASDLRGAGIGRQMLRWTIERCRERGCRLVQLTTNAARTDAQRFYVSLGFTPSHVGMKLPLDPPSA